MKEQKWEKKSASSQEFFDSVALMNDDIGEIKSGKASQNRRMTELRRRIEERHDSRRIARQFDYEFDELDTLQ